MSDCKTADRARLSTPEIGKKHPGAYPHQKASGAAEFLVTPKGQLILITIFLLTRIPFVVWDGCGDPDHARFIMDAVNWKIAGMPNDLSYRPITSPLYILLLFGTMKWLALGVNGLIIFSTICSLAAHCAVIPLFLSVCRMVGLRAPASLISLLCLQLMPNFWFSSLCGFATIVSLPFFLGALPAYGRYLQCEQPGKRIWWLVLTVLLYGISAAFKLDCALCGTAFLGMVFIFAPQSRRLPELFSLGLIAAGGYLFNLCIGIVFKQAGGDAGSHIAFSNWFAGIFISNIRQYFNFDDIFLSLRAYGVWTIPIVVLFSVQLFMAFRRSKQGGETKLLFCLLWFFPLFLFKHLLILCTAREVLFVSPGMALVLGMYYDRFPTLGTKAILTVAWVANLITVHPTSQQQFLSARLLKSSVMFKKDQDHLRSVGETIGRLPGPKYLVVGTETVPYFQVYSLSENINGARKTEAPPAFASYMTGDSSGGRMIAFYWGRHPDTTELRAALRQGFVLLVYEEDIQRQFLEYNIPFVKL